jgi:hypothetical protein
VTVSSIAPEVTSYPPSLSDRDAQARFPRLSSLTEFGRATARQPMWPGSWNRRLGPAALPQVALGPFWLFLQPNNSQCSNCQIRNTRISTRPCPPMLGILAKPTSVLPKPALSPAPPVLSGAHQARFSRNSARCLRYLRPNNSHRSSSSNRPAQPIGALPKPP